MKRLKKLLPTVTLFATYIFCPYCYAQNEVVVPTGQIPTVDGVANSGEWSDAAQLSIPGDPAANNIDIKVIHDGSSLFVLFTGNMERDNMFPEILLNIDHDQTAQWEEDDWWFHISATDCEYQGEYGNYDSCETVRPNWTAVPNFTPGAPLTDTVEVEIPFSTIGLSLTGNDTIGLAFVASNTFNLWRYWPANADKDTPETWGNAVFLGMSSAPDISFKNVLLSPNPNRGSFTIDHASKFTSFEIIGIDGKRIHSGSLIGQKTNVRVALPPGVYTIRLHDNQNEQHLRMVIR